MTSIYFNDCSSANTESIFLNSKIIAFPGVDASIDKPDYKSDTLIDYSSLSIGEAYTEDDMLDVKAEQAADPIKNLEDIEALKQYLISKGKYRDYMMLVVGINTGLRYSDFSRLKFIDLIDPEKLGSADPFRAELVIEEKKTRNTRKFRVNRHIAINASIKAAVALYLEHTPGVQLGDYLFTSQSNHKGTANGQPKPMSCYGIEHNFKNYAKAVGLDINFGTHTFRKTFGYQYMMRNADNSRALQQLQKMYNHSSEAITLKYIGITSDEIFEIYAALNL